MTARAQRESSWIIDSNWRIVPSQSKQIPPDRLRETGDLISKIGQAPPLQSGAG